MYPVLDKTPSYLFFIGFVVRVQLFSFPCIGSPFLVYLAGLIALGRDSRQEMVSLNHRGVYFCQYKFLPRNQGPHDSGGGEP